MAENIATLALKTTFDGQELIQGFKRTEEDLAKFAKNLKSSDAEARTLLVGLGDKLHERLNAAFSSLKTGNFGGVVAEVASSVGDIGKSFTAAVGPVGTFAAAGVAALGGVASAARGISKDLEDQRKMAERLGTSFEEAAVLARTFSRAGISDLEGTANRFFRQMGQIRGNPTGELGQAVRQLGLDPETVSSMAPVDAMRSVVEGLGNIENAFERADLAQRMFGRGTAELQELLRQGRRGFDQAAERQATFGPGPGTIEAARQAEAEWKKVGTFLTDLREGFGTIGTGVGSRVSNIFGTVAAGLTGGLQGAANFAARGMLGFPSVAEVPTIGGNNQPATRSAAEVRIEEAIRGFRQQTTLNSELRRQALELGIVNERASQQEVNGVREIVSWRQKQIDEINRAVAANQMSVTAAEAARNSVDQAARDEAARRKREEREAAFEPVRDIMRRAQEDALALQRGIAQGLLPQGATANDVAGVRDLLDQLERLRGRPDVTAAEIDSTVADFQQIAMGRREVSSMRQAEEAERAVRLRQIVELEGVSLERAHERLAIERGMPAAIAARIRGAAEANRAMDVARGLATPIDTFAEQFRALSQNAALAPEIRARAMGLQFQRLVSSLGTSPGSFGMTGTGSRSREGLLQADDWRIRGQLANDPNRVPQLLEAAARQRQIQIENQQRDGRVLEEIRDGIGNLIEGF